MLRRWGRLPAIVAPLAAATAAVSAESTTTAAGAIFFGAGFVDIQRPAVHVTAVQSGNCVLSFCIVAHFHESEPSGSPGVPIRDDVYAVNCAELFEHSSNGAFSCVETEVSNKNILHLIFFLEFAEQQTRAG